MSSGYPEASEGGSEYEDGEMDFAARSSARKRPRMQKTMPAPKRPRHQMIPADQDSTLFNVVRQGKMTMAGIVDNWIEEYTVNRSGALLNLIQFFINASGCKGTVTAEMLEEATDGFQDIIKRMTEEFDEDSGDYPLIAPGTTYKRFKSSFCDFVQALVRQCQYQIIYDQYMMENVLTLLTELSNSQVRAFRHTSTLAAMKLMTGLVNVALQISVSLDNTQRQYDAERNKDISKRATEKLDILMEKRKELEEQQNDIESMLNGIFKGIYVHRYRDYIADIRALCMEEIGCWMKMFPKVFLTDSYLKYVGWTLHDKQKEVRMKCLQSLIGLYGNNELMNDLKLFTSRFKDRIVSMILDKEYDVAVHAIKLLVLIHNNCNYENKVLSDQDCDSIFQLVYSCHRPVAVAAAEFLNIQLFQNKRYEASYTKSGQPRGANTPHISDLVLFYIESELHEHATYLVDSLWDVAGRILKDFECMSDMLLEEPAYENEKMDEKQETALVDIMVCAVKQAAEGVPPSGRQGYHKKAGNREKRMAIEDKVKLTEHFITYIPKLLSTFQMDKDKIAGLLQIPRYFDLEYYTTGRCEKYLKDLLDQIINIFDKHTDADVLEQASRTLKYLCNEEYSVYEKVVQPKRQELIDAWSDQFRLAFDIFLEAGDDPDEEEIYNTVQALKRLTALYVFNDLTSRKLYDSVNAILIKYNERAETIPEPLLREAVKFIYYDLVYGLCIAKKHTENQMDVPPEAATNIADLRQRVTKFLRNCQDLLTYSPYKSVQEECYMSICDVLIMFSSQLAFKCPSLKALVQRASDELQHSILEFVRNFVFIGLDDDDEEDDAAKIDALHKRRSLLAAVCKLFVFNMIDLRLASSIFQQYIRFYSDYGDIIKETISRSRHHNKLRCAQTLALSLMTLFRSTVNEQGGRLDHSSQEYAHMKELARRFALTFGLDQIKTRDAVAELHKEGILFALKREGDVPDDDSVLPGNLSFLGILVEFSAKLMRQDKKTVVQYLDKHINSNMLNNQDQDWIPLVTYRNSLLQGAADDDNNIKAPALPKGRRGRKKKAVGSSVIEQDEVIPQPPPSSGQQQQQTSRPMTPQHHTMTSQHQQQQQMQQQQTMQPLTPQQLQQPMTPQPPPQQHHGRMTPQQHHTMTSQHPSLTPQQHHIQMTPQEQQQQQQIGQPQLTSTVLQARDQGIRQIHEQDHSMAYHDPDTSRSSTRGKSRTPVKRKRSEKKNVKEPHTPSKQNRLTPQSDRKKLFDDEISSSNASSRRSTRSAARRTISYAEPNDSDFEDQIQSSQSSDSQLKGVIRSEESPEDDDEGLCDSAVSQKEGDSDVISEQMNQLKVDNPFADVTRDILVDEVGETQEDYDPFKGVISAMLADHDVIEETPLQVSESQAQSEPLFSENYSVTSPDPFKEILDTIAGIKSDTDRSSVNRNKRQQSLLNAQLALAQQQAAMATTQQHYNQQQQQAVEYQQQQQQMPAAYNITSPQAASPMPTNAQYMHPATMSNIVYDPTNPFQNVTTNIQQTPQQSPYYGN